MRRGGRILVLLGLVLGVLTAVGIFSILAATPQQTTQVPTRFVVIAVQNIPARAEISPDTVGKVEWPESTIPPGAFERIEDVTGKLTLEPIFQGQLILPGTLIDKGRVKETRSNASFLVPEGKVAVAFPITVLSGIAGALQPGDTVNIMLTLNPPQPAPTSRSTTTAPIGIEGQPLTQLMLQDVLVLQVGTWPTGAAQGGGGGGAQPAASVITFVLEPQDALALKSARELGIIELALRRAGDHKAFTTEPVGLEYLNRRFKFNLTPALR